MKSLVLRTLALATALAGGSSALSAQVTCFEPAIGASIGVGDDVVLPMQALGFAFPFGGSTYTHVHPCTNGFVYLSNAGVPAPGGALCCSGTTASLVAGSPKICPRWDDLVITAPAGVFCNALPGRAVVTWQNAVEYTNLVSFTMQMQLYASGEIVFWYGSNTTMRTTADSLVGLSPGGGAPVPPVSDLSAGGVSPGPTIWQNFDITGGPLLWDLQSRGVIFTPAGPGYAFTSVACGAGNDAYGSGCYNRPGSAYELFPALGFDLSGQTLTLTPAGSNYLYTTAPLGAFFAPVAPDLGLIDDSVSAPIPLPTAFPCAGGPVTSIVVGSNGRVFLSGAGDTDFDVSAATFLADDPSLGAFYDFDPSTSGTIHCDFDAVNKLAIVTWSGVPGFGSPTLNTWQIVLDLVGSAHPGQIELRFQSLVNDSTTNSSEMLVGYSPGNNALDPGSSDLSATVPFLRLATDILALSLVASPDPTLGTTVTYTIGNIPAAAGVSAHLVSFVGIPAPGTNLGFLGAGGCNQLVGLPATSFLLFGSPTASNNITMPASPSFSGFQFYNQGASLVVGVNALGLLTSNGIRSTIF